jgi:uncharacterized protein YdhG (YjbR/CyaY superfamily)
MDKATSAPTTVDEYIAQFPPEVRAKLERLRAAIHEAVPGAAERIAYRMPAFSLNGDLAFFAAFKNHIGFYPLPAALDAFRERLARYRSTKGSVQFPIGEEPPYDLVKDMVRFRVAENAKKAAAKRNGALPKKREPH